jgi:phosphoribosyl isomerase A
VSFEILPAIDVAGGRLVSVSAGGLHDVEAFGGSPRRAAEAFVEAGATWLHVVDVDRASGAGGDLDLIRALSGVGARVQASGGVASLRVAADALDAGATRVVLSSAVLAGRAATERVLSELGDRAVVGIEADGDAIRSRSSGAEPLPLAETLVWLRGLEPARYLYTSLTRTGGLTGPDVDGAVRVADALDHPVLAAGGIATLGDVAALRAAGPTSVAGCVIGRALYKGLDVRALFAAA